VQEAPNYELYKKFKNMNTIALKLNKINIKKVLACAVLSIVLLLVSYTYLIIQTTVNISIYKNNEEKIMDLDSKIGTLEFNYISLKKNINLDMAKSLGYVEASNINFINKNILDKKLSLVGGK